MSGYRSKKLSSAGREDRGIEIAGLTLPQLELLDAMWGFDEEADLEAWQQSLPLHLSQQVDTLILLVLLEQFDRLLLLDDDYTMAADYLKKFRLH
jgi:uncharacterized membrane protein YwaF